MMLLPFLPFELLFKLINILLYLDKSIPTLCWLVTTVLSSMVYIYVIVNMFCTSCVAPNDASSGDEL